MIPNRNGTIALTANASVLHAALPVGGGLKMLAFNRGPQDAAIELSSAGASQGVDCKMPVPGTNGGTPIFANAPAIEIDLPVGANTVSYVSAGNSSLYLTIGKKI